MFSSFVHAVVVLVFVDPCWALGPAEFWIIGSFDH